MLVYFCYPRDIETNYKIEKNCQNYWKKNYWFELEEFDSMCDAFTYFFQSCNCPSRELSRRIFVAWDITYSKQLISFTFHVLLILIIIHKSGNFHSMQNKIYVSWNETDYIMNNSTTAYLRIVASTKRCIE